MHIDYRRVMVGVLAKHVDRLEREGKIPADVAARIRKKPMRLIGWGGVCVGIAFLLQSIFSWP
jgi:predicted anti-sigma-YlaC factor YlaD